MATLGSNVLTLSDFAKRIDPDGKTPAIADLLTEQNQILEDQVWIEGNLPTGHRTTVRTGLPTSSWRLLNQGIQPSKSVTAQIDEATGMLEAYSEVDVDLAALNGNVSSFRLSEATAFIESMNQEYCSTLFFGNSTTAPEEFTGLANRYASLSADIGQNIIDLGGTGSDNSSIWLISWSPQTICGIFPKGSKAGLQHEDLGKQMIQDANGIAGSRLQAFVDHWQWKCGLAVKDWRYAVRVANIDISDLIANSSPADLINGMIKALHRLPSMSVGKPVFYMNRTVFQMLDIQRRDAVAGAGMVYKEVDGKLMPSFRGIPIKICDQLVETEAQVS